MDQHTGQPLFDIFADKYLANGIRISQNIDQIVSLMRVLEKYSSTSATLMEVD